MSIPKRAQPTASSSSEIGTNGKDGTARPKLLFLAWNFPPVQAIASVRTWNITKYLARLGWDITVVTPKLDVWRHVGEVDRAQDEIRRVGIQQILTGHDWRFLNPVHLNCWNTGLGWFMGGMCRRIARHIGVDDGIGWVKAADQACSSLQPTDVDLIFASGPPFSAFLLAERLSKKLSRPYVLDYRDLWTESSNPSTRWPIRLEARLLEGAAAVTAVSKSLASNLDERYRIGSKLHIITNGYDPEELEQVAPHNFDHFAIVYAGTFYPPERVITPVLAALKRIENNTPTEWALHYYGDDGRHVWEQAARFQLTDRIRLHGRVPRSEALAATRGASIALVITSVVENASLRINAVPGKLFEVLGLRAPILLIAPPGSDAESIAASSGAVHRFSGTDIDGIGSFIEQLMKGKALTNNDTHRFEWQRIAKAVDEHLRHSLPARSDFYKNG